MKRRHKREVLAIATPSAHPPPLPQTKGVKKEKGRRKNGEKRRDTSQENACELSFKPLLSPFRYCSSLFSHCRRELLVNVTGEPYLILDVDDWTKKPTASIQTPHGSVTSITRGYSTQKIDVEFLGDRNIFIHVDLQVR